MTNPQDTSQDLVDFLCDDPDEAIGYATGMNSDGTVNVRDDQGNSINAIAATPCVSAPTLLERVNGTWYAFQSPNTTISENTLINRRSRPRDKGIDNWYNTVFLLDTGVWNNSIVINNDADLENYKGNIQFFKGILKSLGAAKRKKIYVCGGSTFLEYDVYTSDDYRVQSSPFLKDRVFAPLNIQIKEITTEQLDSVDSVLWMPYFYYGFEITFSDDVYNLLLKKAQKFGLILQGEFGFSVDYMINNTYWRTFYKNTTWEFIRTAYSEDWKSTDKRSKNATIKTNGTHGVPIKQLREKRHALATFNSGNIDYAGAIAWKMTDA